MAINANSNSDVEAHFSAEMSEEISARRLIDEKVRAYVDAKSKFVYYETAKEPKSKSSPALPNPSELEESAAEPATDETRDLDDVSLPSSSKELESAGKYPFPEMTPLAVFEEYLGDAFNLDPIELYHRTSRVTESMISLQEEWTEIDKICRDHEDAMRLKSMTAAEKEKAIADEKQEEEDATLCFLEAKYSDELRLSRKPWIDGFSVQFLEENPDGQTTLDQLNKLRDSAFYKGFKKRQRALQDNRPEQLVDKPLPDPKQSKEERDLEARKRRHLTDRITFDDMMQADAYGFSYNASDLSRGNQIALPKLRIVSLPRAMKAGTRPPRGATKGSVVESGENSEAVSEEELPQKRSRAKPRKLEEDANGASSAAESSRGTGSNKTFVDGDGVRRYFGSGKVSGRPATTGKSSKSVPKSKLHQMSLAASEQNDQPNGIENEDQSEGDGELLDGQFLGSDQEDELHLAAESLVNQTSTTDKRKRGGRPKKQIPSVPQNDVSEAAPKPKGKGGRKKKVDSATQEAEQTELGDLPAKVANPKGKPGRKKRARDDDATADLENFDEPTLKKIKSEAAKKPTNATRKTHDDNFDGEDPLASIENPHSTQSSRPTTSSSKPTTTSKPTSRAVSRAASRAALDHPAPAASVNGKRARDGIDDGSTGTGNIAGTSTYNSGVDVGAPARKKAKTAITTAKVKMNGHLTQIITNGGAPENGDEDVVIPKAAKKRASAKRKHEDGAEGTSGAVNTANATNNNSGAEDGDPASKKSKRSREKTEAEKKSQSDAMRKKWSDPQGKMRLGIERRKRREARKTLEKNRAGNGPINPNVVYKSDDEGFSYVYWGETPPAPAPPPGFSVPAPQQGFQQIQQQGLQGQVNGNTAKDENIEEGVLEVDVGDAGFAVETPGFRPITFTTSAPNTTRAGRQPKPSRNTEQYAEDDDEDGEFAVESPETARIASSSAIPLTTTRSGRKSKPSRKVGQFGGDGAGDESDVEEPHRPTSLQLHRSESAYDEFQKLTSPGHQGLGKRISKPLFQMNYGTTSEEDED